MVRIRMKSFGRRHRPFFRICAMDARTPRDGRSIEELGHYDPTKNPPLLDFDVEKAKAWIGKGATASETVQKLIDRPKA